ncbi:TIGR03749 family integrating conjugative element protein [Pseudomonas protegens]|uniref:TIGR03749 family integrating conjugative element protein n=1 Tax=Pseudomonas protegens TaxID=380021 RepID=A0A2T6GD64_9PSED|nr:TIGR03749 family integrating conjugative element protein [Pseudomonas protegens]PUA42082.1 TIGR03749 family integrating conjugative element protein [Pseudomonas protegens]
MGLLLIVLTSTAQAVEIMRWERIPLALPLVVGQERIVFVDQNVRVGRPPALADSLRVQTTGGAIYLLANDNIPPSRLQLQSIDTGEIMLMDIVATPAQPGQPPLEPVKIVAGETPPPRYGQKRPSTHREKRQATTPQYAETDVPTETEREDASQMPRETPIPVVLTRYAAQALYAPLRTVEPVAGITQLSVKRQLDLSTLLPTQPVDASLLGAWKLDDFQVSAVKLRNRSAQPLSLDPRELMGDFVAATFQHPLLGHRGDPSDTTVLYLVTRGRSLAASLPPRALSQIDPQGGHHGRHDR